MADFTTHSSNELKILQRILEQLKLQNKLLEEQINILNAILVK